MKNRSLLGSPGRIFSRTTVNSLTAYFREPAEEEEEEFRSPSLPPLQAPTPTALAPTNLPLSKVRSEASSIQKSKNWFRLIRNFFYRKRRSGTPGEVDLYEVEPWVQVSTRPNSTPQLPDACQFTDVPPPSSEISPASVGTSSHSSYDGITAPPPSPATSEEQERGRLLGRSSNSVLAQRRMLSPHGMWLAQRRMLSQRETCLSKSASKSRTRYNSPVTGVDVTKCQEEATRNLIAVMAKMEKMDPTDFTILHGLDSDPEEGFSATALILEDYLEPETSLNAHQAERMSESPQPISRTLTEADPTRPINQSSGLTMLDIAENTEAWIAQSPHLPRHLLFEEESSGDENTRRGVDRLVSLNPTHQHVSEVNNLHETHAAVVGPSNRFRPARYPRIESEEVVSGEMTSDVDYGNFF